MADSEEPGTFLGMKTSNAIIVAVLIIVIIGLIYFVFMDSGETTEENPEKEDDKCLDKFNILEVVKKINSKQAKNLNKIKAPDI